MKIAYVLYPDFTALDLVGPLRGHQPLARRGGALRRAFARSRALRLRSDCDPRPPFDSGSPTKADASTLRLDLRVLLGDRPVRMATRMNSHAVAARLRRARRALSQRRANKRRPAELIHK
jgi:hypothetical protein